MISARVLRDSVSPRGGAAGRRHALRRAAGTVARAGRELQRQSSVDAELADRLVQQVQAAHVRGACPHGLTGRCNECETAGVTFDTFTRADAATVAPWTTWDGYWTSRRVRRTTR